MPRTLLRTLTAVATSLAFLVLTALPALAAAGTKPDPDKNPYLIGSMEELVPTAIVGAVLAVIVVLIAPKRGEAQDDHH